MTITESTQPHTGNRRSVSFAGTGREVSPAELTPPADVLKTAKNVQGERIALGQREIYIDYTDVGGQGKSKLQLPAAKTGTGRNINTVAKLAVMAKE